MLALLAGFSTGCEKELKVYDYQLNGLNFIFENAGDTVRNYSFVYGSASLTQDTVWVEVESSGFLSENNRYFELKQLTLGTSDAVSGKHYNSFEDPEMKRHFIMPGNSNIARVPIVLFRDASLKDMDYSLSFTFSTNENFGPSIPSRSRMTIVISDRLVKPVNWALYAGYYFGDYGPVKHQFMINISGEKWDDDYLANVIGFVSAGTNQNYDPGYSSYLTTFFAKKLEEENIQRVSLGLDVLRESDGTIVTF